MLSSNQRERQRRMDSVKEKPGFQFFPDLETVEDIRKTTGNISYGLYFVAFLQAVIGYFTAPPLMIDAAIYAVLGFVIYKFNSRTAALMLLGAAGLSTYNTILNMTGVTHEGGGNIFLAYVIIWMAINDLRATLKYHQLKKAEAGVPHA
jgi:hypothetical protein